MGVYPRDVPSEVKVSKRPRQARSVANDDRILEAALRLLDHEGWEACSVARVAEDAGLSRPPILNRYVNRTGVVDAVWRERLLQHVRDALMACVGAVAHHDAVALQDSLAACQDPDPLLRAAIEVILVSRYEERLGPCVIQTLDLDAWVSPRAGLLTPADAARNAFVLSLALGMLVEARRVGAWGRIDTTADVGTIATALETDTQMTPLPAKRAEHLLQPPVFEVDNAPLAAVLGATLVEVGTHGFEGATLQRIANASGYSTGVVFQHYESKRELFLDATMRMLTNAQRENLTYLSGIAEEHGPSIADAVLMREFLRPDLRTVRTITLEQYRMAWHDPVMEGPFRDAQHDFVEGTLQADPTMSRAQAESRAFIALSRGVGIGVLADLTPDAWKLPFDVVTRPLLEGPPTK